MFHARIGAEIYHWWQLGKYPWDLLPFVQILQPRRQYIPDAYCGICRGPSTGKQHYPAKSSDPSLLVKWQMAGYYVRNSEIHRIF